MNIVKSFRSKYRADDHSACHFYWGLGDDGKLYYNFYNPRLNKFYKWISYQDNEAGYRIYFEECMEISKQFGHLLVFT